VQIMGENVQVTAPRAVLITMSGRGPAGAHWGGIGTPADRL
jgi:hypothetical protein